MYRKQICYIFRLQSLDSTKRQDVSSPKHFTMSIEGKKTFALNNKMVLKYLSKRSLMLIMLEKKRKRKIDSKQQQNLLEDDQAIGEEKNDDEDENNDNFNRKLDIKPFVYEWLKNTATTNVILFSITCRAPLTISVV